MITGILIGAAAASGIIYISGWIEKWFTYTELREWIENKGVNPTELSKQEFKKLYIMYQLEKIPGVEVTRVEPTDE